MVRIVVAGALDCDKLAHADYVAMSLSQSEPTFEYKRIAMKRNDWETWIVEINKAKGWHYYHSPIAWTEPAMWGGKAYLIGGASAFLEYCHEHYGVLTALSSEMIQLWKENLQQMYKKQEENRECRKRKCRRITISGAANPMTPLLVSELLRLPEMKLKNGIILSLYDDDRVKREKLMKLERDLQGLGGGDTLLETRILKSLDQGLSRCHLMIILDEIDRLKGENLQSWLRRNSLLMKYIGNDLQSHAKSTCRVVLAAPGPQPLCFNAAVIADNATLLSPANIVAVTADLALEFMSTLHKLEIDERRVIECPKVWGFIGINQWVDLNNTVMRTQKLILNKRGEKAIYGSTLPLGIYEDFETTMRGIISKHPNIWVKVKQERVKMEETLKRHSHAAKVRATIDLLKCWFTERSDDSSSFEAGDNNYVGTKLPETSLGIASTGQFGIPKGMYFSQPVTLKGSVWIPNENIPIPKDEPGVQLADLIQYTSQCLKSFAIGKRFDGIWLLSAEGLKKYKQREEEKKKQIDAANRDAFIKDLLDELLDHVMEFINSYKKPPASVGFSDSEKASDFDDEGDDEKADDEETEDEANIEQEEDVEDEGDEDEDEEEDD